jgi:1,4-alpha-glucan branching enzyme
MLNKKFIKSKKSCQVTFFLPEEVAAKRASVVGEFNGWDATKNPMSKVKGVWKATVEVDQGREYQYRYFVNDGEWYNDPQADKYVNNNIDGDNSVVVTYSNN